MFFNAVIRSLITWLSRPCSTHAVNTAAYYLLTITIFKNEIIYRFFSSHPPTWLTVSTFRITYTKYLLYPPLPSCETPSGVSWRPVHLTQCFRHRDRFSCHAEYVSLLPHVFPSLPPLSFFSFCRILLDPGMIIIPPKYHIPITASKYLVNAKAS